MHVWSIAFGCIIGWGSFVNPGKKFLPNSGVAGTAIAMVLGALVMIIIAFSYAYMVPKYPKAGGEFTFTKECYGKIPAYVCGWFLVAAYLTNVPMNSTAIPLIIEGLFGDVLNWGGIGYTIADSHVSLGGIVIASAILILFGFLNIVGVKKAGVVQTILAALLATCAVTLCVAGLASGKASGANFSPIWGYDKKALAASGVYSESMANQNKLSAVLAKDARIVADAINEAYAHKGEYENLFWDDIVDRKLKEIDLTVHPINSDTIVEIDSVKELETIDPDYKNFN